MRESCPESKNDCRNVLNSKLESLAEKRTHLAKPFHAHSLKSNISSQRFPESTWAEVRTAYASGLGLRELARNLGIPAGTVLARSKREGWTRHIHAAKALASRPASGVMQSSCVTAAAAVTMAERGKRHVERVAGIVERTLPAVEAMAPGAILDRIEDIDRLDKVARRTYGLADGDGVSIGVVNIALLGMTPEWAGTSPVVGI